MKVKNILQTILLILICVSLIIGIILACVCVCKFKNALKNLTITEGTITNVITDEITTPNEPVKEKDVVTEIIVTEKTEPKNTTVNNNTTVIINDSEININAVPKSVYESDTSCFRIYYPENEKYHKYFIDELLKEYYNSPMGCSKAHTGEYVELRGYLYNINDERAFIKYDTKEARQIGYKIALEYNGNNILRGFCNMLKNDINCSYKDVVVRGRIDGISYNSLALEMRIVLEEIYY